MVNRRQSPRSIGLLLVLVVAASIYGGIEHYRRTLTGLNPLDGIIGVMLGLFICSHPAANLLDLLYRSAGGRSPASSALSLWVWLLLNLLTLLAGFIVIFIGTMQFTRAAPAFR